MGSSFVAAAEHHFDEATGGASSRMEEPCSTTVRGLGEVVEHEEGWIFGVL
jgi:hypothetical protein